MNPLLLFTLGSLLGSAVTLCCFALYCRRKVTELNDTHASMREAISRNAYARGYETARAGGIKTA
jgi:hypothetical protein